MSIPKPVLLLILDGWGLAPPGPTNAISLAATPNWDRLNAQHPNTTIQTSGAAVGLPDGQMGNSEVGHMNLGAGRVVYQDFTRVSRAVENGELARMPTLKSAVEGCGGTVHVLGLWSPGGVHSHEDHLLALIDAADELGAKAIAVHAILDGRDMPPRSAEPSLRRLLDHIEGRDHIRVASIGGRYYAMDRDNRWDRVSKAWRCIVDADGEEQAEGPVAALEAAYAAGHNDEFVPPTVIGEGAPVGDGDLVVFGNFRADRARQLTQAFVQEDFAGFEPQRRPALSGFVCLTEYQAGLPVEILFPPEDLTDTLGEVLEQQGRRQLRIAETEKYAHVTFFFSGGREQPFAGEDRKLIPSPDVATYDLKPEMSLEPVTDGLCAAIEAQAHDLIVCNIANPDMVGHTGVMEAAVQAVGAVDRALGRIANAIEAVGGVLLITADHGNIEQMVDPETGGAHTAHTTNLVPLVGVGIKTELAPGALCDLAPTILELLEVEQPAAMTGRSLLPANAVRAAG